MSTTPRLKIAYVFDDSLDRNDGVQQYVKTIGAWMSAQGHQVSYFVGQTKIKNWENGKVYSLARNLKIKFNANNLSIPLPSSKKTLSFALDAEEPDILHVQVPYSPFMAQKVINSAPNNTAVIGTFHILPAGNIHKIGSKLLNFAYGNKLKRFDRFLSVSAPAQQFAKEVFNIDSTVMPNVVDIARFRSSTNPIKNRIVFLGRLVDRKGAEHLIKSCALLTANSVDYELIIAGDGPDKLKLQSLAKKLNIENQTNFIGFVSEQDKPSLLASAHIACFPSLYGESFGIVLIEAMSAGSKVVLAGDNPGYSSVMSPRSDQLFNPLNHSETAELIERFLKDDNLSSDARKWQQNYVKKFDVNFIGKKIQSIYLELLENKVLNKHNY